MDLPIITPRADSFKEKKWRNWIIMNNNMKNKFALEVIKYYVHEFCFIIVVLMFCLLGQQLQDECEKLEGSILQKWYIYNAKHTKHLRIFKMAASQRMPIHIFGTITLSLPTFTWFIRTGTSFFTLMMSFMEEQ